MRWVTTVVLLVVLAGLGVYIAFNKESLSSEATLNTGREKRVFSAFKPADASKIGVTNAKGAFSFEKSGETGWKMTAPRTGAADLAAIDAILSDLEFLEARRSFDAAEPSFELESPRATVVVESGAAKRTIAIGAADAMQGGVYAKVTEGDGPARVVRIEKRLFEALDKDASQFRDKKLSTLAAWQIEKLTIESPAGGKILAEKEGGNWIFKEPFVARGDSEKIRELQNSILGVQAVEFVNDAPAAADLATYGLDAPRWTVTFEGAPKEIGATDPAKAAGPVETFRFGAEAPNDALYASKQGGGVITVSDAVVSTLKTEFDSLRDHRLFSRPAETLSRIEIAPKDGKKTVLVAEKKKKEGADDDHSFSSPEPEWKLEEPSAAPADRDKVAELARKFKELKADSFAPRGKDLASFGLAEPSLTIAATLETGGETWTLLVGSPTEDGASRYAKTAVEDHVYVVPKDAVAALEPAWYALRDKKLLDFLAADAQAVTVTRDGVTTEYVQKGTDASKEWFKKAAGADTDAKIDRTEMTSFLAKFSTLRADSFAGDDLAKTAELGLPADAPSVVVKYSKEVDEPPKEGETATPVSEKKKVKVEETKTLRVAPAAGADGTYAVVVEGLDLVARVRTDVAAAAATLLEKTGAAPEKKPEPPAPQEPPKDAAPPEEKKPDGAGTTPPAGGDR